MFVSFRSKLKKLWHNRRSFSAWCRPPCGVRFNGTVAVRSESDSPTSTAIVAVSGLVLEPGCYVPLPPDKARHVQPCGVAGAFESSHGLSDNAVTRFTKFDFA